jgi:hypothetical protein
MLLAGALIDGWLAYEACLAGTGSQIKRGSGSVVASALVITGQNSKSW